MVEINLLPWPDKSKKNYRKFFILLLFVFSLGFCFFIFKNMQQSLHQAQSTIHTLQATLKEKSAKPNYQRQASLAANFPLSQLKWAGCLEKPNLFWGLILLPNGETHPIKVGSVIGKENGLVLKLNKNEIVIQLANGEIIQMV